MDNLESSYKKRKFIIKTILLLPNFFPITLISQTISIIFINQKKALNVKKMLLMTISKVLALFRSLK